MATYASPANEQYPTLYGARLFNSSSMPVSNGSVPNNAMALILEGLASNRNTSYSYTENVANRGAGSLASIPLNTPLLFASAEVARQLHALKFLPLKYGVPSTLNPVEAWDSFEVLSHLTDDTDSYPITDLSSTSTKTFISVPASPEVGENYSFYFNWSEQNVIGGANRKTLPTPVISSVELIEPSFFHKITTNSVNNNVIQPDYLRINLSNLITEAPEGTTRFFHLRINGVDLGSYGSEEWASSNGGSSQSLLTTHFSYGPMKIEVAVYYLVQSTTFVDMNYNKSDLSAPYTFDCEPDWWSKIYPNYGTYGMPNVQDYYGSKESIVSETQTITSIPEEKNIKIIEVSDQTYRHSTLHPTSKWGLKSNPTYTPIFIDGDLTVGKFKGTIKVNRKKIYASNDKTFFAGSVLSQIESVTIKLLAPYKYPKQFNKYTNTYVANASNPLLPGTVADVYNGMASKYFPNNDYNAYDSRYNYEHQPRILRDDEQEQSNYSMTRCKFHTAIENILKKRYILDKDKIEKSIAKAFIEDPDTLFVMDQRTKLIRDEIYDPQAAVRSSADNPQEISYTFYGNIRASFKLLTTLGKEYETRFGDNYISKFDYKLTDLNTNKAIQSGSEYTVLMFGQNTFGASSLEMLEGNPGDRS